MFKKIILMTALLAGVSAQATSLKFNVNRSDFDALIVEVAADNEISLEKTEALEGNDVLNILIEKSGRKGCRVTVSRVIKHESGQSTSQTSLTKKGLFTSFDNNCVKAIESIFASYL